MKAVFLGMFGNDEDIDSALKSMKHKNPIRAKIAIDSDDWEETGKKMGKHLNMSIEKHRHEYK